MQNDVNDCCQTTHEELCNEALEHYEQISTRACHWNSLVPKAIEYYRDNYREDTANDTKKNQPITDMDTAKKLRDYRIVYLSFFWVIRGDCHELIVKIPSTIGWESLDSFRRKFMREGWLVTYM